MRLEEKVSQFEEELASRPAQDQIDQLENELCAERAKVKQTWKISCKQLAYCDDELASKDEEIAKLKARIAELMAGTSMWPEITEITHTRDPLATLPVHGSPTCVSSRTPTSPVSHTLPVAPTEDLVPPRRSGKAPPIDVFTGENMELHLEDWLPTLERASAWNNWTNEELLIQFAGHLQGKAFQEWNLMSAKDKEVYTSATQALKAHLDPGAKILSAQDFRHTSQRESESVGEFI